jgi:hypothetical protein
MSDALSYFGAITGGIGAITGIIGSVLGVKAYRRTSQNKALNLRIDLQGQVRELSLECQQLPGAIAAGRQSRLNVASARGRTGADESFAAGCDADIQRANTLGQQVVQVGDLGDQSEDLSVLERRLIELRAVYVLRLGS